ncbi:hypothetical protein EVG20_g7064 [Dentipellis fragilis]|uniref:Shr3 amino acid permease chaperone n=1 Tax=Dentipellis fragilis TaxID=205917 RepID=A0A4Y9YHH1_9AGAM|nr:hypothetical protein EVG20_g7064 [Dentipellis fragilis]
MALRQLAVIGVTSFLLGEPAFRTRVNESALTPRICTFGHVFAGLLFTHWIADSLTLWKAPVTDANLWTAASYYHIILKGSPYFAYSICAVVALGAVTILWSLRDGEAGNIMFDGGSIFLYVTSIVFYLYSAIPTLLANFTSLPERGPSDDFPKALKAPTLELASSHLVCSVALTGVLALQAGRWWAERADSEEDKEVQQAQLEEAEKEEKEAKEAKRELRRQQHREKRAQKSAPGEKR